jgi:hypothetical protein
MGDESHDLGKSGSSRRAMLSQLGAGMGMIGLAAVWPRGAAAESGLAAGVSAATNPLAARVPHFAPRAKHIIHLWMNGAPSQVDTFDPKPMLARYAGQRPEVTQSLATENATGGLMPSPFRFRKYGQSGLPISELLPETARHADDLCVIRSMHTNVPVHESSNWMMFTGSIQPNRPSYGSWLLYGLGTENEDLPGFVVLGDGQPVNGPSNWSNRFLPGIYQGCQVALPRTYEAEQVIPHLKNRYLHSAAQRRELDFVQELNQLHRERQGAENALDARIESLELAFRMQAAAVEAFDVRQETAATRALYGLDGPEGEFIGQGADSKVDRALFGRNCLQARRLVERGVRVVQVYTGKSQPWDTHSNNNGSHENRCRAVDRPIAGLLQDLKQRGLLDETIVLWGGEFGRTPTSQGNNGRDHNHYGFTVWMAGGGVRGGMIHGATDEFGFTAVEDRVHVHDLHATILHLMGLDHEQLTFRYSGRDFRLTDVHGSVVKQIIRS